MAQAAQMSKLFNIEICTKTTSNSNHAFLLAKDCSGFDLVISCGGDGTNNEVINGIMQIPNSKRPVWSYVPCGSANDFARMFAPSTLFGILTAFHQNNVRSLDLICLTHSSQKKYALNMVTCGIGAEIAKTVNSRKSRLPSSLNYYSAILWWLAKYSAPTISVKHSQQCFDKQTLLLALGNGKFAGNGLGLCPNAFVNDGFMAITHIENVGVIDFIKYQRTLKQCRKVDDVRVNYDSGTAMELSVIKGKLPIETDGEFYATISAGSTLSMQIIPNALLAVYDFDLNLKPA